MNYQGIHHVGLLVTDKEKAKHFFLDVLGFHQHERIPVWFLAGASMIHVIEVSHAHEEPSSSDTIRHVAPQVENLSELLPHLLAASLEPFQMDLAMQKKHLTDLNDDLSYGTGTLFVSDRHGSNQCDTLNNLSNPK